MKGALKNHATLANTGTYIITPSFHDHTRDTIADRVKLLTTGTDSPDIDYEREQMLEAADHRRAEMVGEEVTFVTNLNNVTTA